VKTVSNDPLAKHTPIGKWVLDSVDIETMFQGQQNIFCRIFNAQNQLEIPNSNSFEHKSELVKF
jgi:hypothetical protein